MEYLMRHHPGFWKRLVRRAGDHDCGQRRNLHIVAEFHGDFLKILHDHGRLCHAAPRIEVLPGEQIHACMMCEKRFLSKGGCGAHLFVSTDKSTPCDICSLHHTAGPA